jgi:hypothetical protein
MANAIGDSRGDSGGNAIAASPRRWSRESAAARFASKRTALKRITSQRRALKRKPTASAVRLAQTLLQQLSFLRCDTAHIVGMFDAAAS